MNRTASIVAKYCVLVFLATIVLHVHAESVEECRFWGKPYSRTFRLDAGYRIKLVQITDRGDGIGCRALVLSPKREIVTKVEDWSIKLYERNIDIDGDGQPDLVLESYSGGMHCCWTYWIIAPSKRPALRKEIENERGITFRDLKHNGNIIWLALDGNFDYFDDLCHACTVFPDLYLQLKGDNLIDMSPRYRAHYDHEIHAAQLKLRREHLEDFVAAKTEREMIEAGENIKPLVLTIVLEYLYSGRPQLAWKSLDNMWPPFDRDRIKGLILKTRAKGLLRYTEKPK